MAINSPIPLEEPGWKTVYLIPRCPHLTTSAASARIEFLAISSSELERLIPDYALEISEFEYIFDNQLVSNAMH
jgi:hypothetical protein